MNKEIIKEISDKKDQRLEVLEELIQNINNGNYILSYSKLG